jgi:hypothetical protein
MCVKFGLYNIILFLTLYGMGCSGQHKMDKNSTFSLFDGKSFNGWEGDLNWFRIESSAIVAGSLEKEIPYNVFLCTEKEYGDFELRLEAKLIGPGDNSGIQFRSERIPGDTEVRGYQADMGGPIGDFGVVWGSLYDESRRNKMLVIANQEEIVKVYRQNDWNEMVVRCQDNHIQIWVNGYQSVDYTEDDESIAKKGIIGVQIHAGAPAEAWFRNITLTEG